MCVRLTFAAIVVNSLVRSKRAQPAHQTHKCLFYARAIWNSVLRVHALRLINYIRHLKSNARARSEERVSTDSASHSLTKCETLDTLFLKFIAMRFGLRYLHTCSHAHTHTCQRNEWVYRVCVCVWYRICTACVCNCIPYCSCCVFVFAHRTS